MKTTSANADASRTVRHSAASGVSLLISHQSLSQASIANRISSQTKRIRNVKLPLPPPPPLLVLRLLLPTLRLFLVPTIPLRRPRCQRKVQPHSLYLPTFSHPLVTSTCILFWHTLPPPRTTTL